MFFGGGMPGGGNSLNFILFKKLFAIN